MSSSDESESDQEGGRLEDSPVIRCQLACRKLPLACANVNYRLPNTYTDVTHTPNTSTSSSGSSSDRPIIRKHDTYCWICHCKDIEYECQWCPRSYHKRCKNKLEVYPRAHLIRLFDRVIMDTCQECVVLCNSNMRHFKNLTTAQFTTLLTAKCQQWIKWLQQHIENNDANYRHILQISSYGYPTLKNMNTRLAKVTDMKKIKEEITSGRIQSMEGIVAEIKWLYHNAVTYYGRENNDSLRIERFEKIVHADIYKMLHTCIGCQLKMVTKKQDQTDSNFPCQIPHPVVWAKVEGYPLWPAKIISKKANAADGSVEVFFFHSYDTAKVKLTSCQTFSKLREKVSDSEKNRPGHKKRTTVIGKAIMEANAYLDNLAQNPKVGRQVVGDYASPIVFSSMTKDFVKTLFPEIDASVLEEMVGPISVYEGYFMEDICAFREVDG